MYQGATSWFICDHFRGSGKAHHAFDSFVGLPEPTHWTDATWQPGETSRPVEDRARATPTRSEASFYPGWIREALPEVMNRQFCFVHIDV